MERKDKKLYVYTTAFRQPVWVHKLNEEFSLPFAIKMSAIVILPSNFSVSLVFTRLYSLP